MKKIVIIILCSLIIIWGTSSFLYAQKLQEQLLLTEQQIERNPLIAPPSTLKITDFSISGDYLLLRGGKDIKFFRTAGNSMLPIVGNGGLVAVLSVRNSEDVSIGTFIIFELDGKIFGHQVVEIGNDAQGWFAQTKGVGNIERDFIKLRLQDIKYRVVLVIY